MRKFSLVLLAICIQANDIRITEVMSNPQGSEYENEFIEIYNLADHVMYINGWILSDGNAVDTLVHWMGPPEIQPSGYGLILDPSYNYDTGPYHNLIPDSISIFTISTDLSFGSGGLANSGESAIIYSPDTSSVSQMSWTSSSQNGYSWERDDLEVPDSLAGWQQSQIENGTPGYRNSIMLPQPNLSVIMIEVLWATINEPVEVGVLLQNTGEHDIEAFAYSIYRDANQDGTQNMNEWAAMGDVTIQLGSGQTVSVPIILFELEPGVHHLEFSLTTDGDEVLSDDTLRVEILGEYPVNSVSVTEIMSSPGSEQGSD